MLAYFITHLLELKVQLNQQMNQKPITPKPNSNKLLLYVIAVIITVTTYQFLHSHQFKRMLMTQEERVEDTMAVKPTSTYKEDSVTVATGKIPRSNFEEEYSAPKWVNEFKANRVLFNSRYDNKKIDICGTVKDISTSISGYSIIHLDTEDDEIGIICNNVKNDKDMWVREIENVAVGNQVHIRGTYNSVLLDQDNLYVAHCHILY